MNLLENFISYVKIDTQSDGDSISTPSSENQFILLNLLKSQLEAMDVECNLDEFGRLYAYLPGNEELDTIGVCAHVDTAGECSGKNVNPQIIKEYDLSDIALGTSNLTLSLSNTKKLHDCKGKTLITTDGTTLLGGDDKCGVAIIMQAIFELKKINHLNRHPMSILFTPDEEIGRGHEHFDVSKYKASYAYTLDGDDPKYICYENFNARGATVSVKGISIHPGDAKDSMVNAAMVLNKYISFLPKDKTPDKTEKYEGFIHLNSFSGDVESATGYFIIRDHDKDKLEKMSKEMKECINKTLEIYPKAEITIDFKDQYKNMYEIIKKDTRCKVHIEKVYKEMGLKYEYTPIRGGTDGATFSFKGCPTPNLGTGSYNHHGKLEFAVLEEMNLLVEIVKNIYLTK